MKRALVSILFLSFSLFGFSQNFNGGLLAGMSATQVDGDTYAGYNRVGLIAGVWVSRSYTPLVTIRSELRFIQKGSYRRFTDGAGGTTGFYSIRLNYAEMPFLVEYKYRENIIPYAGLSFGYLWKAVEKNADGPFPEDEQALFEKLEFAANAGVEYKLTEKFSFCATFSYSIFPIRRYKDNVTYRWDRGQLNNVLQFYVRYHY
ncbi:MAG TPA: outer membrane beta-barrel protein [Tenuifilaceae bacterium]|nr:outer membrane beta-barrel protein [Tenuifilaceae bacterium]